MRSCLLKQTTMRAEYLCKIGIQQRQILLHITAHYQISLVTYSIQNNCIQDSSVNFQDLAWNNSFLPGITDIFDDSIMLQSLMFQRHPLWLKQPSLKCKVTLGNRLFTCPDPKLWNALPFKVRDPKLVDIFKNKLSSSLIDGHWGRCRKIGGNRSRMCR